MRFEAWWKKAENLCFKQIKNFNYSLDLSLSNKYFKVILKFFRPDIFNEKVDFYSTYLKE